MDSDIYTNSLRLTLPTVAEVFASLDAMSESDRAQLSPVWLALARAAKEPDPWIHGFSMVHRETSRKVGSCGYKGPPDADGVIEIAYAVEPAHQGRGYATEAAQALADYAFRTGRVSLVRAHTLREENASTRVLSKCGFTFVGEVVDAEDGPVWRWELRRPSRSSRSSPS
jgi:RimJ/RimL family protein N-acetyltransferase